MAENNNNTQVANQPKIGISQKQVEWVTNQLVKKKNEGLHFPANYSIENAMQSAYLMLKEAETKDKKPLLTVCTQESIVQALMQMATQGLNPIKKQCYFVAYGSKCRLVPSYFGTLAILNRVKMLKRQPVANVVRQGDVFEYGYNMDTMEMFITKHETKLENIDNEIIAAYAVIVTDRERTVEIMSRKQIEKAWGQGDAWKAAVKGGYESKTHKNFPEEMAKKTVLNRAAKRLINATDDSSIMGDDFIKAFNETEDNDTLDVVAEQVAEEIHQNANTVPFTPAIEQKPERQTVAGLAGKPVEKEAVPVAGAAKAENAAWTPAPEEDLPDFMKG